MGTSVPWSSTAQVQGPAEGGPLFVGIQCTNMPTDGSFAFWFPGPDGGSTAWTPMTRISNPNLSYLVPVTWPGGFGTVGGVAWWQGATPPPPGAAITLQVMMPAGGGARADTVEVEVDGRPERGVVVASEPFVLA